MTKTEYAKWRKNGNFTISQDRLLEVSNHISEGMHDLYTKKEAAQVATYWSLEASGVQNKLTLLKTRVLAVIVDILVKHPKLHKITEPLMREVKKDKV